MSRRIKRERRERNRLAHFTDENCGSSTEPGTWRLSGGGVSESVTSRAMSGADDFRPRPGSVPAIPLPDGPGADEPAKAHARHRPSRARRSGARRAGLHSLGTGSRALRATRCRPRPRSAPSRGGARRLHGPAYRRLLSLPGFAVSAIAAPSLSRLRLRGPGHLGGRDVSQHRRASRRAPGPDLPRPAAHPRTLRTRPGPPARPHPPPRGGLGPRQRGRRGLLRLGLLLLRGMTRVGGVAARGVVALELL